MMPSALGATMSLIAPQSYVGDPTLDELSRQLALSESMRRISRCSNGQHTPGGMRVTKPRSANNSPQALMARRRTLMNDGNLARRRQPHTMDQVYFQQQTQESSAPFTHHQDPVKRNTRPVSWHPSSHLPQQPMHLPMPQPDFSQYMVPAPMPYSQADVYAGYQNFPPTPAAYSGHTSPASTFSPISLPYAASYQAQPVPGYVSADTWNSAAQFTPQVYSTSGSPGTEPFPSYTGQNIFNWTGMGAQGLNGSTTPTTPDDFQPGQQSQPAVPPEDSIPYQPLEEPEEEGEILVGMGLYDPPSKTDTDPSLDNYRTTTSQLLGTTYRRGHGWKLEEAWEPPSTDDEDDEDDKDVEGEDDEEKENEMVESTPAHGSWI
ncbi:hypothetical protein F4778DRAFT_27896 [Xylariomycetidae sp. FL2044]|nr:hypothetical protein F4778DRAFT_27896 [Xylariomycetidae sp. FL2044]